MTNLAIQKTKTVSPMDQVRQDLLKMEGQFKMALPANVTPEKFIRICLTAIQNTPDLLNCDRQSLYSSAMKCAADGLLPDGREAAFVKYNTKQGPRVQYMPMIGGLFKKLRNSNEIASITSQVIHKNDRFRYWVDSNGEHLEHEPLLFGGDRGERVGVYALAKMKDGGVEIEPMTEADVMAVKAVSKSKDSGPWSGSFESEMWRKTAIRRLSKRLPMSTEIAQVLERDDEIYDLKGVEHKTKSEELSDKLMGNGGLIELQAPDSAESIEVESKPIELTEFDKFQNDPMNVK